MNMKFNKLALVLVIVLMASTLAPAFAKSPFADVPADHWAYDSVIALAAAGLIEGYPDGTFGGTRMMTRYEAAMLFARAMVRLEDRVEVYPELDAIKAELVEEIKAQLAAFDAPVETVIERVIVDKDVDADALARIRANEIAAEALEGDIAYVENRVLGLIDGIRYDVNKLQEQAEELEVPSIEEIEKLIADRIEAGLLEAALAAQDAVQEPTIIEKIVMVEAELSEADVEFIAQALIAEQLEKYEGLLAQALFNLTKLEKRVDELELAQADLASKEDVEAVKQDVEAVKAAVEALEKVKLSGTLTLGGKYYLPKGATDKEYSFDSDAEIALNLKYGKTNVVASFDGNKFGNLNTGKVVVTSETPINKLSVGKLGKVGIGHPYVLGSAEYDYAGLAEIDLAKGLTSTVLLGGEGASDPLTAGLAFSYKFIPELGVKVAASATKEPQVMPEPVAVGAGIFGGIGSITYEGNFALDLGETEENTIFDVSLGADIGPLNLNAKYVNMAANFGVDDPFKYAADSSIEVGAGTDFLLGIDISGKFYHEAAGDDALVNAYMVEAAKSFDLGALPLSVSARYAGNQLGDDEDTQKSNIFAKLGFSKATDLGLKFGASVAYEQNVLDDDWKVNAKFSEDTVATLAANVGYEFDWRGALLDLGYDASFAYPVVAEGDPAEDSVLTHELDVGYSFAKDVKLTLGGKVVQTLADPLKNDFTYKAGLTIKF